MTTNDKFYLAMLLSFLFAIILLIPNYFPDGVPDIAIAVVAALVALVFFEASNKIAGTFTQHRLVSAYLIAAAILIYIIYDIITS